MPECKLNTPYIAGREGREERDHNIIGESEMGPPVAHAVYIYTSYNYHNVM